MELGYVESLVQDRMPVLDRQTIVLEREPFPRKQNLIVPVWPTRILTYNSGHTITRLPNYSHRRFGKGRLTAAASPPTALATTSASAAIAASRSSSAMRICRVPRPEERSIPLQRHLSHLDAAAAKAAFAVHEVVTPEAVEAFVEAGRQTPLLHRHIVAFAPAAECLGIMEAVALPVLNSRDTIPNCVLRCIGRLVPRWPASSSPTSPTTSPSAATAGSRSSSATRTMPPIASW